MINITTNVRDGMSGNACGVCCCEPIGMRPGEQELITINYAPWSVPFGGRGLVPTPEITVTKNDDACSNTPIDGFSQPNTGNVVFNTERAVTSGGFIDFDMASDTFPTGNTFTYKLEPVSGPRFGVLSNQLGGDNLPVNGQWRYTSPAGANGWDQIWVRITDAQGRSLVRPVNFKVGAPSEPKPLSMKLLEFGLLVDRTKLQIDERRHLISIPVMLQPSAACDTVEGCKKWRVTIKAFASDCDRIFSKIDCFEVYCRKC